MKLYDASSDIWELDYRGITRSGFEGTAALTPAALDNPDEVTVTLPRNIGSDFVVVVSGKRGTVTKNSTIYDIYGSWTASIFVAASVFTANVIWHVFERTGNVSVGGPWNNLRQLCADMDPTWSLDDIPDGVKRVCWIVRLPL